MVANKIDKAEVNRIILENEYLKKRMKLLEKNVNEVENKWSENIDSFVDQWYAENNETIDIGILDFKLFKIDIFPDYLEKYIYKKIIKIMFSFLKHSLRPKELD